MLPSSGWSSLLLVALFSLLLAPVACALAGGATFTNLANMVPIRRDEGVLKRWKGTPLPTWTYVAGFIFSAVIIALVGVIFMLTLGVVAYGLEIDAAKMPAAVVTFLVGVGAFAALGMALSAVVKSASFGVFHGAAPSRRPKGCSAPA